MGLMAGLVKGCHLSGDNIILSTVALLTLLGILLLGSLPAVADSILNFNIMGPVKPCEEDGQAPENVLVP
jgi:hypothetical protein